MNAFRALRHFVNRHRRIVVALAAMGMVAALLLPRALGEWRASQQWREVQSIGWLGFGIDPGIAPFSFYDDSGWNGLDADVARAICREVALKCASEPVGFDAMYDALRTRRTEAGMSAWVVDPAVGDIRFSRPYFVNGLGIALRPGLAPPTPGGARQWLVGKRVAVQFGGDGDAYLRRARRDGIATDALAERTLEDAIARVRSGTADAVLLARADAMRLAPEAAFVLIEPEPYAIAVAAHNTRLLAEINAALDRIEQSGELAAITRRWLERR